MHFNLLHLIHIYIFYKVFLSLARLAPPERAHTSKQNAGVAMATARKNVSEVILSSFDPKK